MNKTNKLPAAGGAVVAEEPDGSCTGSYRRDTIRFKFLDSKLK
jgi:hypothetical protein